MITIKTIETLSINYEGFDIPVDEALSKLFESCWVLKTEVATSTDELNYKRKVYRNSDGNLVTDIQIV